MRPRDASDAAGPLARLAEPAARGRAREKLRESLLPEEEGPARRRVPGRSFPRNGRHTKETRKLRHILCLRSPRARAAMQTPQRNASRGRRRRRQHRRGHVAQQVAVAPDVHAQARVLAFLLVEAHAQAVALVHEHLLLPPQRVVLFLEVF